MKRYTDDQRPATAECYDCGFPYESPAWIEAVVSNDIWEIINPTYHKGTGLLCINCIAKRCIEAGLENVPVMLAAGPFALEPYQPYHAKQ